MKYLNILGTKQTLNSFGENGYKTLFGLFFSLFVMVVCIALSLYFLIRTISRSQPRIMSNDSVTPYDLTYDVKKFPFIFGIHDAIGNEFTDHEKYFKIIGRQWTRDENLSWGYNDLKVEKCDYSWYPDYQEQLEERLGNRLYFCVNPNDSVNENYYQVEGVYKSSHKGSFFIAHYLSCSGDHCASKKEIEQKLLLSWIKFVYVDFTLNNKKESPETFFINQEEYTVSIKFNKLIAIYMKTSTYFSDAGYVFEDYKSENYYGLGSVELETTFGGVFDQNEFAFIRLSISDKKTTYYRNFPKLQEAVAQIGGVIKFIYVVSYFINYYLTQKYFIADLVNNGCIFLNNNNDVKQIYEELKNSLPNNISKSFIKNNMKIFAEEKRKIIPFITNLSSQNNPNDDSNNLKINKTDQKISLSGLNNFDNDIKQYSNEEFKEYFDDISNEIKKNKIHQEKILIKNQSKLLFALKFSESIFPICTNSKRKKIIDLLQIKFTNEFSVENFFYSLQKIEYFSQQNDYLFSKIQEIDDIKTKISSLNRLCQ